jgi:glycosyltransferase involved in cell wall biosynthesis
MFANFNAALKEARGEYFLMLDDHDYLEPTCIDTLMQPWRIRNNLAFSYGQYWYHDHLGARLEASAGPEIEDGFDYVANYWTGERATLLYGCLFRKQSLLAAGGFPEMMALDVLAILRTAFEGGVAYVRQPVTHYELQPTSMTHNIPLCRLIQEREEMLQTCLRAAAARQISRRRLENLEFRVYKDLARQSASTLLLLRGRGLSRAALMKESRQLTRYLRHRWVLSAICSTLAFTFPPATVNWFRRWHRRLGHLPADDISLGLRPGLSGGRL